MDCLLLRAGSENKDGLNRCEESYWDDGNVLRLDYDDGCIICLSLLKPLNYTLIY